MTKEFDEGSIIYNCTVFKGINTDGSFHVPKDSQHDILFWPRRRELFLYRRLSGFLLHDCPVRWISRIHRLLLCRGMRLLTPPNESPGYDTKQSDGEVPVMLELWGMQSTLSLPLLLGPLWPVVIPDRVLFMGQI